MKYGNRTKFLSNMNFVIVEGCAVVKFEEQEKTKTSELREWIDEGLVSMQREEQGKQKQKPSKNIIEWNDTPLRFKNNIDKGPIFLDKVPFSTNEELTMKHLVSAYEEFSNLEQTNPNDIKDFVFHINALQRILGQRVLRRDYPNTFLTHK
jgi:hypothetical protein